MPLILSVIGLLLVPSLSFAHGTGASFEIEKNGYFIDVGYDPAVLVSLTQGRFDFSLSDAANRTPVDFDRVWVRVEKEGKTFFAGGVASQMFGPSGFITIFPEEGSYTISARFEYGEEALVEVDMPFEVVTQETEKGLGTLFYRGLMIGLLGGSVVSWFVFRDRQRLS